MKSLIRKLVETPGPSGYESQVREVVRTEIEPLADRVYVDNLGNLIAQAGADRPGALKIMVAAHLDEIGILATHVDDHGFVRFISNGTVFPRYCPASRVRFLNGAAGVIGAERLSDLNRVASLEQLFIDVGATSPADCPVRVGDVAVFERPFLELGDRLVSKALDNRIGVAVMIETMRSLKATPLYSPHQLFFVFSVQEEVGVRGATTAAFAIEPDVGIAVEITPTGDTPKGIKMNIGLGKGPAIKVRDQGMLSDPRIVDWMVETAETNGLPYQLEILELGSTDARAIQLSRAGAAAGCLSVPCRYVHSPSEMVDFEDVQNAVRLLTALLHRPLESLSKSP